MSREKENLHYIIRYPASAFSIAEIENKKKRERNIYENEKNKAWNQEEKKKEPENHRRLKAEKKMLHAIKCTVFYLTCTKCYIIVTSYYHFKLNSVSCGMCSTAAMHVSKVNWNILNIFFAWLVVCLLACFGIMFSPPFVPRFPVL